MKKKMYMSKYLINFLVYHFPSLLVKDLCKDNQNKNGKSVKRINESLKFN